MPSTKKIKAGQAAMPWSSCTAWVQGGKMERDIASIMHRDVMAVDIDDTVEKVEQLINEEGHAFVPVLGGNGKPFGVISASDLVHFHAGHENPKLKRAWEICSHRLISVPPGTAVRTVVLLMLDAHVHHVVITHRGDVLGLVSSLDILESLLVPGKAQPTLSPAGGNATRDTKTPGP